MVKKKLLLFGVLAFGPIAGASNQTFIFSGTQGPVSTTITNPYNGTIAVLSGTYNVNQAVYTGTGTGNTLLLTNATDLITLDSALTGHTPNVQTVVDIQSIFTGNGDDFVDLASANFILPAGLTIFGGSGTETIWTNSAATTVNAGSGNTTILAGAGNDILNGGTGADNITGGAGTDTVISGGGDDFIVGGPGDLVNGGTGTDTLVLELTAAQRQADSTDIAAAQSFITANFNTASSTGPQYTFTSPDLSGLTFSNVESLVVPEPSALSLLVCAAAALSRRRR